MITQKILEFYKNEMDEGWFNLLHPFLISPEMENIRKTVLESRRRTTVFPKKEDLFTALKYPLKDIRVVVLGQDPYFTENHAHGLAFSSIHQRICPPSLRNILAEVENDCYNGLNLNQYEDWCLDRWAKQGVLLLNTALTVEKDRPESHIEIWKPFTEFLLTQLTSYNTGLVFLLWGSHAKSYKPFIKGNQNILESVHPSPLSAYRGFFGCKHFSKTNEILKGINGDNSEIIW